MNNAFFAFLAKEDVEYKRNVSIKELSSVKIGGIAPCVIYPDTAEKLALCIQYLFKNNISYKIIGRMSNVLMVEKIFNGVLVSTASLNRISIKNCFITAECGASYSSLLFAACEYGYYLDAELFGIPGSLGGMVYSNAGAYDKEISDRLIRARVYSQFENKVLFLEKSMLDFSYRNSRLKKTGEILLSASFSLSELKDRDILKSIAEIKEKRRQSQPLEYPSLGSVFKRYNGISAGYYIDKAGLKGFSVGGAMVSSKHAGFIVNTAFATADDYITLINTIKEVVYNKFQIMLEEEIEYI